MSYNLYIPPIGTVIQVIKNVDDRLDFYLGFYVIMGHDLKGEDLILDKNCWQDFHWRFKRIDFKYFNKLLGTKFRVVR